MSENTSATLKTTTPLEQLQSERRAAFKEVQRLKDLLGQAENRLYAAKQAISEHKEEMASQ